MTEFWRFSFFALQVDKFVLLTLKHFHSSAQIVVVMFCRSLDDINNCMSSQCDSVACDSARIVIVSNNVVTANVRCPEEHYVGNLWLEPSPRNMKDIQLRGSCDSACGSRSL